MKTRHRYCDTTAKNAQSESNHKEVSGKSKLRDISQQN